IPRDREVLFLPDLHLGLWLQRVTGRALTLWLGECHVHAGIRAADLQALRAAHSDAELLIHPECGCASSVLDAADEGAHILSTEGMVDYAERSSAVEFLVATEVGILHRFSRRVPAKRFTPVDPGASCPYMKLTTLEKLRDALLHGVHEVSVPAEIADRARGAIARMVAVG
ncbi:MAG: quinolinate synthase NadA, partial [Candidatus Limnocylindrales bacterium]